MIVFFQGIVADPTVKPTKTGLKKALTVKILQKNDIQKYSKLLEQENKELNAQLAKLIKSTKNYVAIQYKRLNTSRLLMHGNLESQARQSQLMQQYHELEVALHALSTKNGALLDPVSAGLTHVQYLDESAKSVKIAKEIADHIEHVSSKI